MNVKFNIAATRVNCFTPSQAQKVDTGIEIFKRVINSEEFRNSVNNFQWRTNEGMIFNRFYMSNGMSNHQVWEAISNQTNWTVGLTNVVDGMNWGGVMNDNNCPVVNVVPCSNRDDVMKCCNDTNNPCICIDTNVLNNTWYTPVHVACAIMHEWCCLCEFCPSGMNTGTENWSMNSVPMACAWICKDLCAQVCNAQAITDWCDGINNNTFTCYPCTTTYNAWSNSSQGISIVTMMDQCMNLIEQELSWVQKCDNSTPDIANRELILKNSLNAMHDMKINMCNTSLDGSDVASVPTVMMSTAN